MPTLRPRSYFQFPFPAPVQRYMIDYLFCKGAGEGRQKYKRGLNPLKPKPYPKVGRSDVLKAAAPNTQTFCLM